MAKQPVYYMQTDPKWANVDYTAKGETKNTLKISGCGPTSAAMLVATLKDKSVTPVEAAKWSLDHGYKAPNQGTYYSLNPISSNMVLSVLVLLLHLFIIIDLLLSIRLLYRH